MGSLDLIKTARLDFCAPDLARFPYLKLAYEALNAGGTTPAILNAANEVAVASFLNEKISFMAIPAIIEQVLSSSNIEAVNSIQQLEAGRCTGKATGNKNRLYTST